MGRGIAGAQQSFFGQLYTAHRAQGLGARAAEVIPCNVFLLQVKLNS